MGRAKSTRPGTQSGLCWVGLAPSNARRSQTTGETSSAFVFLAKGPALPASSRATSRCKSLRSGSNSSRLRDTTNSSKTARTYRPWPCELSSELMTSAWIQSTLQASALNRRSSKFTWTMIFELEKGRVALDSPPSSFSSGQRRLIGAVNSSRHWGG